MTASAEDGKCHNISCSYAEFCRISIACVAIITTDMRTSIACRVAQKAKFKPYEHLSLTSLMASNGKELVATIHKEQASIGCSPCFVSPY